MRVVSLDLVRAMAIVFVVVGHALIHANCGGFLMGWIYSFHMALLFVLSGFVAAASWERSGTPGWRLAGAKVARSARRLLVPYALCGAVVIPVVNFLLTDEFVSAFANGWKNAFLLNRLLWYLPCCFFLVCIFSAVSAALRGRRGMAWVSAVAVAFAAVGALYLLLPQVDYLRSVASYFVPFFTGAWLWTRRDVVLNPSRRLVVVSTLAFLALSLLYATLPSATVAVKAVVKPLAGVASFVPFVAVANRMGGFFARGVAYIGRITLFLYCFDFCATPIAIRHFRPGGVLITFVVAFGVVAFGAFLRIAWDYAIVPRSAPPSPRPAA